MLLPITTTKVTRYQSPAAPFHFCRHNGVAVLEVGYKETGRIDSGAPIICADSIESLNEEIKRLELAPLPQTKSQKAAEFFQTLPEQVQTQFGAVFQAVSALSDDKAKVTAIKAVTVPEALAETKAALLAFYA